MTCAGRFKNSEGATFPPVDHYDFPQTNLPVRGTADRTFRWIEVSVPDIYLFTEVTANGGFETAGGASYAQLTSGTGVDTSFTSWTLSGNATYRLTSTVHHYLSGTFPGQTGDFYASSLSEELGVGMYPISGTTASLYQNLGTLAAATRYQVYAQVKAAYPTSGNLRCYVRGNTAAPVCYYNPQTVAWETGKPTGTMFSCDQNVREILYSFYTTGYPGTTPTNFDVVLESDTAAYYILDEVHVDQYQAKNAFVDFTLPSGYMIQITPDLGWHDVQGMFDAVDAPNPHLATFGPFSADMTGFHDELDGSVSVTLTETQMRDATSPRYRKYLWRALAVSPNGTPGEAGVPVHFEYIGSILENEFAIDHVSSAADSHIKVIRGRKTTRMRVTVDGLDHPGMTYPTDGTWLLTFPMSSSSQRIAIQGVDAGGASTSIQYLDLESTVYQQNEQALWNVFDEHGLVMDLPRLPGESNREYKDRIKDVGRNPGGLSFIGIVNGGLRELGMRKIPDAIQLSIPKSVYGQPTRNQVTVHVSAGSIRLRTDTMQYTEAVAVDPVDGTVLLSKLPYLLPEGTVLDDEDEPYIYRIKFEDPLKRGQRFFLTYEYQEELKFKDLTDLGSLVTALKALRDPAGMELVKVVLQDTLSGNEPALGLYQGTFQLRPNAPANLAWSPIILRRVSDRDFRGHFRNEDGSYWRTPYYRYVQNLKANTNAFWGHVEADLDYWNASETAIEGYDVVPTLFDPETSYYQSEGERLDATSAFSLGYHGKVGERVRSSRPRPDLYQDGIGYGDDLQVTPYVTVTADTVPIADTVITVTGLQDNHGMLFSGISQ